MTRTEFLREQAITGANKCRRTPFRYSSVSNEPCSLTERKALATRKILDDMPVYIGSKELIVGTRTLLSAKPGNEDGHDIFEYGLNTEIPYLTEKEIEDFGQNLSYNNKTHYTPDFSIILHKGIDGIIHEAKEKKSDATLNNLNREFLSAVIIVYTGLKNLILRYADEADAMAKSILQCDVRIQDGRRQDRSVQKSASSDRQKEHQVRKLFCIVSDGVDLGTIGIRHRVEFKR
jgi:hypothetical protein